MFYRMKLNKRKVMAILSLPLVFLLSHCAESFDQPVTEKYSEKAYVASADGSIAVITHGDTPKHVKTISAGGSNDVAAIFGHVYVNRSESNTVVVVDANKEVLKGSITVGERPIHSRVVKGGNLLLVGNDGPRDDVTTSDDDILVAQDDSVSVIDSNPNNTSFMTEIARIRVGNGHHIITYSDETQRVAVSNLSSRTVSIIDLNALVVMCTVPVGIVPHGIDYSHVSGQAYNANVSDPTNAVTIINLDAAITIPANPYDETDATCTALITGTIAKGSGSGQIPASGYTKTSHDGAFIYTAGYDSATTTGYVSAIRASDNSVVSVLSLTSFKPDKFSIKEDNDRMYVSSVEDAENAATVPGTRIAVIDIDPATGVLTAHATIPFISVGRGHDHRAIALSSDDLRLFVPNSGDDPGTVSVIDTASMTVIDTFQVGDEPNTLAYVDAETLELPTGVGGEGAHSH